MITLKKLLHKVDNAIGRFIPDKTFLKIYYRFKMGVNLDLKNPRRFTEKLQWLKLYDRNPHYTELVDKYKVKDWVNRKIGEGHVIPLLGAYDSWDDIDFDKLPDQFVLKCTHNCGVVICHDKKNFDISQARKTIEKALKGDYYLSSREWPYKNVPRKILVEKYMVDESGVELKDYKFFCFDGEPKLLFIATDRTTKEEPNFDFFDLQFNHLPIKNGHPNSKSPINKPPKFEEMIEIARTLSKGLPHVRVDLFNVNGTIYVGEMTFFHFSGLVPFEPDEWDFKLGEMLKLPQPYPESRRDGASLRNHAASTTR